MSFKNSWLASNWNTNFNNNVNKVNLVPGQYVCQVMNVIDNGEGIGKVDASDKRQYITLELDIVEGAYANYYNQLYVNTGHWLLTKRLYYTKNASRFFKENITRIEISNPGYKFDGDPKSLMLKYIGVNLISAPGKKYPVIDNDNSLYALENKNNIDEIAF